MSPAGGTDGKRPSPPRNLPEFVPEEWLWGVIPLPFSSIGQKTKKEIKDTNKGSKWIETFVLFISNLNICNRNHGILNQYSPHTLDDY